MIGQAICNFFDHSSSVFRSTFQKKNVVLYRCFDVFTKPSSAKLLNWNRSIYADISLIFFTVWVWRGVWARNLSWRISFDDGSMQGWFSFRWTLISTRKAQNLTHLTAIKNVAFVYAEFLNSEKKKFQQFCCFAQSKLFVFVSNGWFCVNARRANRSIRRNLWPNFADNDRMAI